jgi:hypothetical protein
MRTWDKASHLRQGTPRRKEPANPSPQDVSRRQIRPSKPNPHARGRGARPEPEPASGRLGLHTPAAGKRPPAVPIASRVAPPACRRQKPAAFRQEYANFPGFPVLRSPSGGRGPSKCVTGGGKLGIDFFLPSLARSRAGKKRKPPRPRTPSPPLSLSSASSSSSRPLSPPPANKDRL